MASSDTGKARPWHCSAKAYRLLECSIITAAGARQNTAKDIRLLVTASCVPETSQGEQMHARTNILKGERKT